MSVSKPIQVRLSEEQYKDLLMLVEIANKSTNYGSHTQSDLIRYALEKLVREVKENNFKL